MLAKSIEGILNTFLFTLIFVNANGHTKFPKINVNRKCDDVGSIACHRNVKFVEFPLAMEESNGFHSIRALNWFEHVKKELSRDRLYGMSVRGTALGLLFKSE